MNHFHVNININILPYTYAILAILIELENQTPNYRLPVNQHNLQPCQYMPCTVDGQLKRRMFIHRSKVMVISY
jgi:hypothetical protein